MSHRRDQAEETAGDRRSATYTASYLFVTVGLTTGVTAEDDEHLRRHPGEHDYFRPVIAGEAEAAGAEASGATDVHVYPERDFDGRPTGQRHRTFLRRVKWHW